MIEPVPAAKLVAPATTTAPLSVITLLVLFAVNVPVIVIAPKSIASLLTRLTLLTDERLIAPVILLPASVNVTSAPPVFKLRFPTLYAAVCRMAPLRVIFKSVKAVVAPIDPTAIPPVPVIAVKEYAPSNAPFITAFPLALEVSTIELAIRFTGAVIVTFPATVAFAPTFI